MREDAANQYTLRSAADDSEEGKFRCPHCKRLFKRLEHMKRHEWCHTGWKRFRCETCGKCFTRSDALGRHEATHEFPNWSNQGMPTDNATSTKRGRACMACARARDRCTKTQPCRRCQTKSIDCIFPGEASQQEPGGQRSDGKNNAVLSNQSAMSDVQLPLQDAQPSWPTHEAAGGVQIVKSRDASAVTEAAQGPDVTLMAPIPTYPVMPSLAQPLGLSRLYEGIWPSQEQRPDNLFLDGNTLPSADAYQFPMNWLPASEPFDLVYDSMFGLEGAQPPTDPAITLDEEVHQDLHMTPRNVNYGDKNASTSILSHHSRRDAEKSHSQFERRTSNSSFSPSSGPRPSESAYSPSLTDVTSPSNVKEGLYATSAHGARVPCTIRSRAKWPPLRVKNAHPVPLISKDPTLNSDNTTDAGYRFHAGLGRLSFTSGTNTMPQLDRIEETTYSEMQTAFRTYCLMHADSFGYPLFASDEFPSRDQIDHLVAIYLLHLAHTLPIIHTLSLNLNDYWPLTLAMAAVGCQYTRIMEFQACASPFHEFVRRVLVVEIQKGQFATRPVPLLQALVLSQVGMLYHGDESLKKFAIQRHGEIISFARSGGLLQEQADDDYLLSLSCVDASNIKASWLLDETRRRVGYSIWWLDCLMEIHFETEASLHLGLARASLPNDDLWTSDAEGMAWSDLSRSKERNPSLEFAVHQLFHEKHVKSDLGEFSRILILHGIYQEILQTKKYMERPLSNYVPFAAQTTPPRAGAASEDKELPTTTEKKRAHTSDSDKTALLRDWRNAALDCVDALHWDANAVIALSRGAEHPAVLHLHLSRVILLVPYGQIIKLASFVSQSPCRTGQPSDDAQHQPLLTAEEAIAAEQQIVEWVQRDEFKARLAALHSGCLYWHIRRYSSMAFYEPISLFLATLTLWAYSRYTSKELRYPHPSGSRDSFDATTLAVEDYIMIEASPEPEKNEQQLSSAVEDTPEQLLDSESNQIPREYIPQPHLRFMHLDRPCDDEMVQSFVRVGRPSNITAHITGVGDLSAPEAPVRILEEGMRILDSVSLSWGRTLSYRNSLEALRTATAA